MTKRRKKNKLQLLKASRDTVERAGTLYIKAKRREVVHSIATKYLEAVKGTAKPSERYGIRSKIFSEAKIVYPWITDGTMKYSIGKLSAKCSAAEKTHAAEADVENGRAAEADVEKTHAAEALIHFSKNCSSTNVDENTQCEHQQGTQRKFEVMKQNENDIDNDWKERMAKLQQYHENELKELIQRLRQQQKSIILK